MKNIFLILELSWWLNFYKFQESYREEYWANDKNYWLFYFLKFWLQNSSLNMVCNFLEKI